MNDVCGGSGGRGEGKRPQPLATSQAEDIRYQL